MAASTNIPGIGEASKAPPALREPKTFAVKLSAELAAKVGAMTGRDGREVGDLLGDAFEECYGHVKFGSLQEVREYATTCNPHGYTEDDIPRLIKEVRTEQAVEAAAREAAKAS